jgi:hypothetical protein
MTDYRMVLNQVDASEIIVKHTIKLPRLPIAYSVDRQLAADRVRARE